MAKQELKELGFKDKDGKDVPVVEPRRPGKDWEAFPGLRRRETFEKYRQRELDEKQKAKNAQADE